MPGPARLRDSSRLLRPRRLEARPSGARPAIGTRRVRVRITATRLIPIRAIPQASRTLGRGPGARRRQVRAHPARPGGRVLRRLTAGNSRVWIFWLRAVDLCFGTRFSCKVVSGGRSYREAACAGVIGTDGSARRSGTGVRAAGNLLCYNFWRATGPTSQRN